MHPRNTNAKKLTKSNLKAKAHQIQLKVCFFFCSLFPLSPQHKALPSDWVLISTWLGEHFQPGSILQPDLPNLNPQSNSALHALCSARLSQTPHLSRKTSENATETLKSFVLTDQPGCFSIWRSLSCLFADQNNKRVTDGMLSISCEKLWPKDSTPSALPTLALS